MIKSSLQTSESQKQSGFNTKSFIILTITSICWALPPALGKLMMGEISPVFIASFRLFAASLFLTFLFMFNQNLHDEFHKMWHLSRTDKLILFIGGVFEGVHYVLYFEAIKYTTALSISILVNIGEIFVALSGFIFFKEKMTNKFIAAIFLALIGIMIIVTNGNFTNFDLLFNSAYIYGDFLIIMSALLFSIYAVTKKHLIKKTGPLSLVIVPFMIGSLILVPFAIHDIQIASTYSTNAWILLLLMTIFGSALGYFTFAIGLKYTDMSTAGIITLSSPVFAIIFSLLLVPGEKITFMYILGSILIILSVFFISTKK